MSRSPIPAHCRFTRWRFGLVPAFLALFLTEMAISGCGRNAGPVGSPQAVIGHSPALPEGPHKIILEGDPAFIERTNKALLLLGGSPSFADVRKYVGRIKQSQRSGMRAFDDPPTYEVGDATGRGDVYWYASTIAHDTYHSKLYHEAPRSWGRVPQSAWTGAAAEETCNKFQMQVLLELRPTNPELVDQHRKYLQSLIDNKTDYFSGDYNQRDW